MSTDEDVQVFSDAFLERQLVIAQGLFPHPDDRLFGRAAVPAPGACE